MAFIFKVAFLTSFILRFWKKMMHLQNTLTFTGLQICLKQENQIYLNLFSWLFIIALHKYFPTLIFHLQIIYHVSFPNITYHLQILNIKHLYTNINSEILHMTLRSQQEQFSVFQFLIGCLKYSKLPFCFRLVGTISHIFYIRLEILPVLWLRVFSGDLEN